MYFQATTKNITKTNTLKDKIQMFKAAKIIFTCTLLLLFFAKTNASDFNSAVPIYVIVVDSCLSIKSSGWNIKFDDKACEVLQNPQGLTKHKPLQNLEGFQNERSQRTL